MSRIGRSPINIPSGVEVKLDKSHLTVKGPKGTLESDFNKNMKIEYKDDVITVQRSKDNKMQRSLHGLTRTLISNMVIGVTQGFQKELEINGVGYRAQKQGKDLVLNLGYSHQVIMHEADGITVDVPSQTSIIVKGADKQKVGWFAAEIRGKRPPEPYKGKGIKYAGEYIARKEGKAGKGAKS